MFIYFDILVVDGLLIPTLHDRFAVNPWVKPLQWIECVTRQRQCGRLVPGWDVIEVPVWSQTHVKNQHLPTLNAQRLTSRSVKLKTFFHDRHTTNGSCFLLHKASVVSFCEKKKQRYKKKKVGKVNVFYRVVSLWNFLARQKLVRPYNALTFLCKIVWLGNSEAATRPYISRAAPNVSFTASPQSNLSLELVAIS